MSRQVIEEESGTFTSPVLVHNGYYAGDFGAQSAGDLGSLLGHASSI